MNARADAVRQLREGLQARQTDILVSTSLPAQHVQAQFVGPFQGEDVAWNMTLYTLAEYEQRFGLTLDAARRGLIRIDAQTQAGWMPLQVAILAPEIDFPTLRKVVIMMRNYKKLDYGLRVWGEDIEEK